MHTTKDERLGFGLGTWILIVIGFILVIGYLVSDNTEQSADSKYHLPWSSSSSNITGITKTLIKNGIKGCGDLRIRTSKNEDSEYLVACSRDGVRWEYYLVWPNIGELTGPLSDEFTAP